MLAAVARAVQAAAAPAAADVPRLANELPQRRIQQAGIARRHPQVCRPGLIGTGQHERPARTSVG